MTEQKLEQPNTLEAFTKVPGVADASPSYVGMYTHSILAQLGENYNPEETE